MLTFCATLRADDPAPKPPIAPAEVRGTWLTTTANDAISTPEKTAETMRRLKDIGLNTVYVEVWKNGYTQFPSETLKKVVGVDRRPALMKSDPSDDPNKVKAPGRDLLQETLTEAHRNGLVYIAWFEYGFMAAHKSTPDVHLWKMKPEWLSRDIKGSEIAPNGFVWMNPLHPEARRFLLDIVLEAVDKYDLDGVQLDDRIVWPYITMGYDDYTRKVYAEEHGGKQPPEDHKDPAWMRWRADKINEYSKMFVQEIRKKRPGLLISLSPAPYPWVWENYLLEWPKWAGWTAADALKKEGNWVGNGVTPRWDEFIPQNYRFSYEAFETTWLDQIKHMKELGADRQRDLIAGIRIVGDGKDSSWDQLKRSIELTRARGNGGHVLWFSRGVLDVYPKELTEFYDVKNKGRAAHPFFGEGWRPEAIGLKEGGQTKGGMFWMVESASVPPGKYRKFGLFDAVWEELAFKKDESLLLAAPAGQRPNELWFITRWRLGEALPPNSGVQAIGGLDGRYYLPAGPRAVMLMLDRRKEMEYPDRRMPEAPAKP